MHNALEISLGLNVKVTAPDGQDLTPSGQKDRAVLALLAMSPEHRRRRLWLQDKLWSDRFEEQSRASLRRSLANIRKSFGLYRDALDADKLIVSLRNVKIIQEKLDPVVSEFLEELDVRDPKFGAWLNETRVAALHPASVKLQAPLVTNTRPPLVRIVGATHQAGSDRVFLENLVADMIAERLHSTGPVRIESPSMPPETEKEDCDILMEIDGRIESGLWMLVVRLYGGAGRYFLWSSRFSSQVGLSNLWSNAELPAFVNSVVAATFAKLQTELRLSTVFQLNHAVKQLFTGRRVDLDAASQTLDALATVDMDGTDLALAWTGFERLTRVLEHGEYSDTIADEACLSVQRAVGTSASNPTVLALSAIVEMKMGNDPERALVLGQRAMDLSETNPYALTAVAHILAFLNRPDESYRLSKMAVQSGRNMPNDFTWDMQLCLAALATDRHEEALEFATRSHFKMPNYRPALRYMVALQAMNNLGNASAELPSTLNKLQRIEPGFELAHIAQDNYPMHTFRQLGLTSELSI
jgi:hypothetical protein